MTMLDRLHSAEFDAADGCFEIMALADEQFRSGDFASIQDVLSKADISKMTDDAIVSLLTVSMWVKNKVSNRDQFVQKASQHFILTRPSEAKALMQGLE